MLSLVILSIIIAQSPADWGIEAIANFIGMSSVAGFVLLRLEARMRSLEAANNLNTRGQMLVIMANDELSEGLKKQAKTLLTELDKHENTGS